MQRRGYITGLLVVAFLCHLATGAWAGPRIAGTLVKIDGSKGIVWVKTSEGVVKKIVLKPEAKVKRMGTSWRMSAFIVGEQVQVEIIGPLNDDPLGGITLYDTYTAGQLPPPSAPVGIYNVQQGGFQTAGGPAASVPDFSQPNATAIGLGGNTQANMNVTNPGGPPPGATQPGGPQPNVPPGAANPNANPGAPPPNPGMPPGNQPNAPPANQNPPVNPATSVMGGEEPAENDGGFQVPSAGGANALQPVQLKGQIVQVNAQQRLLLIQTTAPTAGKRVAVMVPAQLMISDARTAGYAPFETLRRGDNVTVSGLQSSGGIVEARQMIVGQ